VEDAIDIDGAVRELLARWSARPAPTKTEKLLREIRTLYRALPGDGQQSRRFTPEMNRQLEAIAEKSRRFVRRPGEAMVVALVTCQGTKT